MAQDLPPTTQSENYDHEAKLAALYREQGKTGVHFCEAWHYMAIHDKSAEFEACQCDLDAIG